MKEVVIRFRAHAGSPHIEQDLPRCRSILKAGDKAEPGLKVVGVIAPDGVLRFHVIDDAAVTVSPPIPFEWGEVSLICAAPEEPRRTAPLAAPMTASPTFAYGLQPPTKGAL